MFNSFTDPGEMYGSYQSISSPSGARLGSFGQAQHGTTSGGEDSEISLLRQAVLDMSERIGAQHPPAPVGGSLAKPIIWSDLRDSITRIIVPFRHFVSVSAALLVLHHLAAAYDTTTAPPETPSHMTAFIIIYTVALIGLTGFEFLRSYCLRDARLVMRQKSRALATSLSVAVTHRVKDSKMTVEREVRTAIGSIHRQLVLAELLLLTTHMSSSTYSKTATATSPTSQLMGGSSPAAGILEGLSHAMSEHLLDPDEADFFSQSDLDIVPVPGVVYTWVHSTLRHLHSSGSLDMPTLTHLLGLVSDIECSASTLEVYATWAIPTFLRGVFVISSLAFMVIIIDESVPEIANAHASVVVSRDTGTGSGRMLHLLCTYVATAAMVYLVSFGMEAGAPGGLDAHLLEGKSVGLYLTRFRAELDAILNCAVRSSGRQEISRPVNNSAAGSDHQSQQSHQWH